MATKCQWFNCSNDAEGFCRCIPEAFNLCKFHVPDHLEQVGFNHKYESMYMRIDPQSIAELREVMRCAKEKIDKEYTNVLRAVQGIMKSLNEKVELELKRVMIIQQNYLAALETVVTQERVKKNTDVPVFQEILTNFQRFKEMTKESNWFTITLKVNEVQAAIDNFIKLKITRPDLYKIAGAVEGLGQVPIENAREERKERIGNPMDLEAGGPDSDSIHSDEMEDFDPNF
ncbi:unnamed protein product [Blepharisma stoltei]|uniref:Uncharacterized protein n=1 Tax=Blepharisma stoltei TaxID=1481888 RepID=A0AAU9I7L9_9CILI|nr:unnamed protein product [Blepharisma stoltei]